MMRRGPRLLALLLAALLALPVHAAPRKAPKKEVTRFAVLAHRFDAADEGALQETIARVGRKDYAFIVAPGIKAAEEDCEDELFGQRARMLGAARDPVIVSLTGDDWTGCMNSKGKPSQVERLNRLREVLFPDSWSLGRRKLELSRLSESAKFRGYPENAYWQVGRVLYATINVPAPNNNFRAEAGRNSEFEDRAIANRAWLERLFRIARLKKLSGLVLFSDADLWTPPPRRRPRGLFAAGTRDGLQDVRRQIERGLQQYPGRVLLVDSQREAPAAAGEPALARKPGPAAIQWRGRLGHLGVAGLAGKDEQWLGVRAEPGLPAVFALDAGEPPAKRKRAKQK